VVIEVDMQCHLGTGLKLHKARATQDFTKTGEHLAHVGRCLQVGRLKHPARKIIVVLTVSGNQRHGGIAVHSRWMSHPSAICNAGDLDCQSISIKKIR